MQIGMMWFDNNPIKPLATKVDEAMEYYRTKDGKSPDLCLVNPSMLAEAQVQVGRVTVRTMRSILPGHLWIGVDTPAPLPLSGHPPISDPKMGGEEQMEVMNV